jgi:nodulation protein E
VTRRVAICGTGAVCAAGGNTETLWNAAREGRSGVSRIDFAKAHGNRVHIGAPVVGFDPGTFADEATLRSADRYTLFALDAARQAIAEAGLEAETLRGDRTAVILGTGVGGIGTLDDGCRAYYADERMDIFGVPKAMPSSAAAHLCIAHGITGPSFTVTSACASSSQAIGLAMQMIRAGIVDRVVTGGAEACLTPATMRGWEYLRVLTSDACRPFSSGRSGMVIGEGAGICVIEAEDAMLARGAKPLAWLAGYGTTSDARDMLLPDVDGAAAAIEAALADAGLRPEAIGYVNAHGTGTVANDINEAAALRKVFGDALDSIPVSSSKPIFGHTLGAAGVLELLVTLAALRAQTVPPQINCKAQDPKCPLYLPLNGAESRSFDAALSNSFAFGGVNAALIVSAAA